jgi:hypothetical protein
MNNRDEIIDENIDGECMREYEEKLNNFFEEKNKRKTKLSALQSLLNTKNVSAVVLRRNLAMRITSKAPFSSLKDVLVFGITSNENLRKKYVEFRGRDDLDSLKLAHQEILAVFEGALTHHKDELKSKGDTSSEDWKNTKAALDRIHSLKSRSKEKTEKPVKTGVINAKATPERKEPPVKLPPTQKYTRGVAVPPGGGDSAPPPSGSLQRRSDVSAEPEREPTLEELDEIERLS